MEWEAGWGNLQQPNVPSFPAGWRNHPKVKPSIAWFAGLEFEQWGEHWKIFLGHSQILPLLVFSPSSIGATPARWLLITPLQVFATFPSFLFARFASLPSLLCWTGPALHIWRAPCVILPLLSLFSPLFLRPLFVSVQRGRMREQIMKHRSAFHTLFRKNSPTAQRGREGTSPCYSTPTFSPDRSSVSTISRFVRVIGSYNADMWMFRLLSAFF